MESEQFAEALILVVHAPLGFLALLAGAIALVAKKGSKIHKKAGMGFFSTMLVSSITALTISILPNHRNPFLFSIGLFSIYFLISGYRSIKFKRTNPSLLGDRLIAYCICLTGLSMVLFPAVVYLKFNVVLSVFGIVGLVFGIRDLRLFKEPNRLKRSWLKLHLGKMTGGYIAAVSAFFVVNQILPGIWNWFVPGIAGGIFIAYRIRKLEEGPVKGQS